MPRRRIKLTRNKTVNAPQPVKLTDFLAEISEEIEPVAEPVIESVVEEIAEPVIEEVAKTPKKKSGRPKKNK